MNLGVYNSVLQTKAWSEFKANFGWRAHQIDELWVLQKTLAFGKSVLYIPEISREATLKLDVEKIRQLAKRTGAIFLKIEPIIAKGDTEVEEFLAKNRFTKSFEELQPTSRQMLDLTLPEDAILAQMKQKGRYNVNLADRKGIKITAGTDMRAVKNFYKLYVETSKRDRFTPRAKIYFHKMATIIEKEKLGKIYLAYHQHTPLAAIIASFYGNTAVYLYGASSMEMRNLMAPYLLHWHVMQDAKKAGCKIYDLLAVSPTGTHHHKYDGISLKKNLAGSTLI